LPPQELLLDLPYVFSSVDWSLLGIQGACYLKHGLDASWIIPKNDQTSTCTPTVGKSPCSI
jgi:hypothetical protein